MGADKKNQQGKSKLKSLKSRKLSTGKASAVKGGFDPQPDPPRHLTVAKVKNLAFPSAKTIQPCI